MRLALDRLSKRFGEHDALSGLSFSIDAPGVIGLLGKNGAGKTTTFKLILGMLRPSSGSARVFEHDAEKEPLTVRRLCGYMPDEPAFYDQLSGAEILQLVCEVRGLDAARMWRWLAPMVDALDATRVLEERCAAYSLGMRKKLALLVAVAHEPKLLLLDEPTNGLDPPSAARAREIFATLAREHDTTVLLSTHLLEFAERACERLVIVDRGHLVADGSLAEIRATAAVAEDATLEEAFMRLVER